MANYAARYKSAVISHHELYRFPKVSFGLHTAYVSFEALMDGMLFPTMWQLASVYLNDNIISA